jgi:hypothetical protein
LFPGDVHAAAVVDLLDDAAVAVQDPGAVGLLVGQELNGHERDRRRSPLTLA